MAKKQKKIVLDEYEKEILEAYENGMLKPSKLQADYQAVARTTMKKNRKINIRISENDLSALQRRAAREGIPYQTLIGSVLHKYRLWGTISPPMIIPSVFSASATESMEKVSVALFMSSINYCY